MESLFDTSKTRAGIEPRDYLVKAHDEFFRLYETGARGVLIRAGTGTGKTPMSCAIADTWLARGPDYRWLIVSYETELVWQFAQEVDDFLGLTPGIEMDSETVDADFIPKVVVASRQSLLRAPSPTEEQQAELQSFGVTDLGPSSARACVKFIKHLRKGGDSCDVRDEIERLKTCPEADGNFWSRLHKLDWRLNWLITFDEAHRHAYRLTSVGHIVDWFERNPASVRKGITATPKRSDKVSLGHKMFPEIALDYPLYSQNKPCAVKDGWAVPYIQKYISVEGVDFRSIAKLGSDFDEADLERLLGAEETLAKLVLPLLDMVGNRPTLIFNPGVEMAKNVARFINARAETKCSCGKVKWFPKLLIGDGATCACGQMLSDEHVTKTGEQARELDGSSPSSERRRVYDDHKNGEFQFLSVCGLCREGYNSPTVACVGVFRPISANASSLAEQVKGRGCRTLKGILRGLETREERLAAIAASAKPNCLVVDLVGITGLADCASTVQIYADGIADELKQEGIDDYEAEQVAKEIEQRAAEILAERMEGDPISVEEAIEQAKREDADTREKIRLEREAAEQRAKEIAEQRARAGAEAKYTEHDVGYGTQTDPDAATDAQYRHAIRRGMDVKVVRSKGTLGRIISMLKQRMPFDEVAKQNHLKDDDWQRVKPSLAQISLMRRKNLPTGDDLTPHDAHLYLDAKLDPAKFVSTFMEYLGKAKSADDVTSMAKDLLLVNGVLPQPDYHALTLEGKKARQRFTEVSDEPIPD